MRPIIQKKRKKSGLKIFFAVAIFSVIFFSVYPSSFRAVSLWINALAIPFWNSAHFENGMSNIRSKSSLIKENEDLRQRIDILDRKLKGYDVVVQENIEMKKLFSARKPGTIFASLLAWPNSLPFDTFLLDVGSESKVANGQLVFADKDIVLGKVAETYSYSAKVKYFSSPGEITDAFLGPENIPIQLKGVGGGAFTVELPRDLDIREGDAAIFPGSEGFIVAYVGSKEENLTDSFQKLYLQSPVNIFELKYVQIIPNLSSNEQ